MRSFSARILAVVAALSLIANVLLYYRYSTTRPLVTVGSDVITKKQYLDQLEHQSGQQVLNKMVFTDLVTQAAARANLTPSAQDVDARLAAIQRSTPQALASLIGDPAKEAEFRQDLQTALALENLRIKNVALTPSDVAAYYAHHKTDFALPEQVHAATVVTSNAVTAATAEDLLRQHQPYDVISRQPGLHVVGINGYNPNLEDSLPLPLKKQISEFVHGAKQGDLKTFRAGPYFLTFQVIKSSSAEIPPLAQIQDQVERAARLAQAPAPQEELARLYQGSQPKFQYDSDKYASYFASFQNYPGVSGGSKKTASVP